MREARTTVEGEERTIFYTAHNTSITEAEQRAITVHLLQFITLAVPAFPSVPMHPLQADQHNETRRSTCAVLQHSK